MLTGFGTGRASKQEDCACEGSRSQVLTEEEAEGPPNQQQALTRQRTPARRFSRQRLRATTQIR